MKKFLSMVMCLFIALTPVMMIGCGGGTGEESEVSIPEADAGKTNVYVEVKSGGTGYKWLVDAGTRFSSLKENEVYEPGTQGVVIIPKTSDNPSINNAESSNSAIIDVMGQANIASAAREGRILPIDDVLTTVNDTRDGAPISPLEKIPETQRSRYIYNGSYYAGPSCEYYPVVSYDRNLFDERHFYLARPEAHSNLDLTLFESGILGQDFYFLSDSTGNDENLKSCGPDGEYGTDDDGLPSSLFEYIALCEYIKSFGFYPLNFTGSYAYYSNFLMSALYTSLQGYEGARNNYDFDGQSEVVVGYTEETLFGLDNVYVPVTEVVDITEANGYLTTHEVEKYYAEAFMQLCINEGWFATIKEDQKAAMNRFVVGSNDTIAMHIDGSYWYNEATDANCFEDWKILNGSLTGFEERDVRIMSLPVNISEPVAAGEGEAQALLDMNYGIFVINSNIKDNEGLLRAAKEFLAFLYTDAELSAYTASTSILRSMDYSLSSKDADRISIYGEKLLSAVSSGRSKIVYFASNSAKFNSSPATFQQSWTNAAFSVNGIPCLYQALFEYDMTVSECFDAQKLSW